MEYLQVKSVPNFVSPLELLLSRQSHQNDTQTRIFFSYLFQKDEPISFFGKLLHKVLFYANSFDEGSRASREVVWKHIKSLSRVPVSVDNNYLSPIISNWLAGPQIDLFALEVFYISFALATSCKDFIKAANEEIEDEIDFDSANDNLDDGLPILTLWADTPSSSLLQLILLQHWESKLEKLSLAHKRAIWNTCRKSPVFDNYEESSVRRTIQRWSENPLRNVTNITILFAALGFLKENNFLKVELSYPKTTIPVFSGKRKTVDSMASDIIAILESEFPLPNSPNTSTPTLHKNLSFSCPKIEMLSNLISPIAEIACVPPTQSELFTIPCRPQKTDLLCDLADMAEQKRKRNSVVNSEDYFEKRPRLDVMKITNLLI